MVTCLYFHCKTRAFDLIGLASPSNPPARSSTPLLLSPLLPLHPSSPPPLAPSDCCLVFHRGMTTIEEKGLFINDKIELLLDYTVVWLAKKVRASAVCVYMCV